MTDNEIVKALECCMNGHCDDGCPFRETREHCHNLDSLILELINRQKEEIEELKSAINGFRGYEDKIKAEARKEFAERLKEQCNCVGASLLDKKIDSLLIEMESEEK